MNRRTKPKLGLKALAVTLIATLAFSGSALSAFADPPEPEDDTVRFGVISDTHVTAERTVQKERLAKAFNFFSGDDPNTPIEKVDNMVVVGDLTETGAESEMIAWKGVKDANLDSDIPLQASMGNHENNQWAYYEAATGNQANYMTKVNGYYFISVSPGSGAVDPATGRATGNSTSSYAYAVSWLEDQLKIAEEDSDDKPIFVFFHHPIKDTFYVSNEWYGSGFETVFDDHPRAVTFSGHIHSPNNISTSIWQDGGYTAINTVSTYYFELERGMIYGSVPPNGDQCAQGLLVEANGSEVTVKNYDILADAWIDQTWTFDVGPETRDMPYTTENLSSKAVAPVFPQDADVEISNQEIKANGVTLDIEFDQAKIPATHEATMGDIVHKYRYDFYEKESSTPNVSFTTWSDFYITPMPETYKLSMEIKNEQSKYLKEGTDYTLKITAIDTFGNESATPLEASFKTIGTYTVKDKTEMNFALKFEDNLNNANVYPKAVQMYEGAASYVDGKDGKAIELANEKFIALENVATNEVVDYDQSFTVAFWMNLKSASGDDPAIVSNKNWNSGGNPGYLLHLKQGRLRWNWTPKVGGRHDDWVDLNPQTSTSEWIHVAMTADKANDTVTIYYNGIPVVTTPNAGLSQGLGGNGNATLLGNSFDSGSSIYNRTGGGNQLNMLMDDFVLVNEVYSAEKIAALADADEPADPARSLIKFSKPFPETVYKDETLSLPEISLQSFGAKLRASLSYSGYELFSTPEPVDELDLNVLITQGTLQSLPQGDYEIKLTAHDAQTDALIETKTFTVNVQNTRSVTNDPFVTFAGPATATENGDVEYKVGLGNIKNGGTVKVEVSYDSDKLETKGATALGGKYEVLAAKENGPGKAIVTLWAQLPGADSDSAGEDVLKLSFTAKAKGDAYVRIDAIQAVSYVLDENGEFDNKTQKNVFKDFPAGGISVETKVDEYFDPYDFNHDKDVDIADLTFAQAYYQVSEGGAQWNVVEKRGIDVNGDKTVDLADLIIILNHINNLEI